MAADVAVLPDFFTDFHKWTVWLESKNSLKNKGICPMIVTGILYLAGGRAGKEAAKNESGYRGAETLPVVWGRN